MDSGAGLYQGGDAQSNVLTYNINTALYVDAGHVPSNCNEMNFYNAGNTTLNVFGLPLAPGLQLSINGNKNELDVTNYYISFTPIAGSDNNQAWVIRKTYNT